MSKPLGISIEELKTAPDLANPEVVLEFLKEHKGRAFSVGMLKEWGFSSNVQKALWVLMINKKVKRKSHKHKRMRWKYVYYYNEEKKDV